MSARRFIEFPLRPGVRVGRSASAFLEHSESETYTRWRVEEQRPGVWRMTLPDFALGTTGLREILDQAVSGINANSREPLTHAVLHPGHLRSMLSYGSPGGGAIAAYADGSFRAFGLVLLPEPQTPDQEVWFLQSRLLSRHLEELRGLSWCSPSVVHALLGGEAGSETLGGIQAAIEAEGVNLTMAAGEEARDVHRERIQVLREREAQVRQLEAQASAHRASTERLRGGFTPRPEWSVRSPLLPDFEGQRAALRQQVRQATSWEDHGRYAAELREVERRQYETTGYFVDEGVAPNPTPVDSTEMRAAADWTRRPDFSPFDYFEADRTPEPKTRDPKRDPEFLAERERIENLPRTPKKKAARDESAGRSL
jgi:hypothetical protein